MPNEVLVALYGRGDVMLLFCHVALCNHMFKGTSGCLYWSQSNSPTTWDPSKNLEKNKTDSRLSMHKWLKGKFSADYNLFHNLHFPIGGTYGYFF